MRGLEESAKPDTIPEGDRSAENPHLGRRRRFGFQPW